MWKWSSLYVIWLACITLAAMLACLWAIVEHDVLSLCVYTLVYVLVFSGSVLCTLSSIANETRAIEQMVRSSPGNGMVYVYVHPCLDDMERWINQLEFLFYSTHFKYERDPEYVPGRRGYVIYWADRTDKLEFELSPRPLPLSSSVSHQPTLGRFIAVMEYVENVMSVKRTRGENWSDTASNMSKDITSDT